ncbi:MAG: hypothetical protein KKE20_02530 [Nanoarchaeota archaeon]|nr:hypothetical protein [Nanoarchaeota archaeon]
MRKTIILMLSLMIFSLVSISGVLAIEKPIEGYIYENGKPLADEKVKIYFSKEDVTCLTYPTIFTDERGYFITNLANLRIMGNNYPCDDRWKKGDFLGVVAKGLFAELPEGGNPVIDSESGASMMIPKLELTQKRFEPMYSELSIGKVKIISIDHDILWSHNHLGFIADIYNPNNVAVNGMKLEVKLYDIKGTEIGRAYAEFSIESLEQKTVYPDSINISEIGDGEYTYNVMLYTDNEIHQKVTGKRLAIKRPSSITAQTFVLVLMAVAIILLLLLRKKEKSHKR